MNKVHLCLYNLRPGTHTLVVAFAVQAVQDGWSSTMIGRVLTEALAGDDWHAFRVIARHCVQNGWSGWKDSGREEEEQAA